ncbi:fumarylacetoacetase [Polaromonas hydrogenivorans]|uniref:fumarylacetoacetase n=1 Tax=Polaromonas hydrogenivorans TaxID=335476 RepID=A0AAU7LS58_9BURK
MNKLLNHTHDPAARSWLESANTLCDFPIQNLPMAVFRTAGSHEGFRGGVAIGDQVVDLAALSAAGLLQGVALQACTVCTQSTLNDLMALGPAAWQALRHALFALLHVQATPAQQQTLRACLVPQSVVEYAVPARIGDYTDFYTSIHHARNMGRIVKPDDPLPANFQWLPIAYHGRASSVVVSGTPFHRPMGQSALPGGSQPVYGPCARLDFELELGMFMGAGNALGQTIALPDAENHIFGVCLLNDWSARDIQFWEMTPLGPFLGKNFCTSISPWVVSLEALVPFRLPFSRPAGEPQPLPYLDSPANRAQGVFDIQLEVLIETPQQRARVLRTSFRHQYWTLAQMVAQHTMGGCNLRPGDLLGTGTISGPTAQEAGALVELTQGGRKPLDLPGGEQRAFLHDGDSVVLRGWCEKPGAAPIGFGECRGTVLPALAGV